jgi:hypothetical protein
MKFLIHRVLLPALLVLALASCSKPPPAPKTPDTRAAARDSAGTDSTRVLIAGERAGRAVINDSAARLGQLLGKPDFSDAAMGKAWLRWRSADGRDSTLIYTSAQMGVEGDYPKVKLVRITSRAFNTKNGLGAGSSETEILRAYPGLQNAFTYSHSKVEHHVLADEQAGIAFDFDDKKRCTAIAVFEKGLDAGELLGIVVKE